jgi:flagellar biosynthesis/type III secretory pathway chaperone
MEQTAFFNELIEIMSAEVDLQERLAGVASEINKCARSRDLDGLQEKCGAYDELISGLERTEDRRIEICEQLQSLLGGLAPSGKVLSLAEYSEPEQKKKLLELKAALTKRVTELKAVNTSNTVLFREALSEIEFSVDTIRESARPKNAYRQKGDFKPSKSSNLTIFNQVI